MRLLVLLLLLFSSFCCEADSSCCRSNDWMCYVTGGVLGAGVGAIAGYASRNHCKGKRGQIGAGGPHGPCGPVGDLGPDGLAGLQGPMGCTGPQGPMGPQGADGPQGPAGQNGLNGLNGSNGSNGADGTNGTPGQPQVTLDQTTEIELGLNSNLFTSGLGAFTVYLVNPIGDVVFQFTYSNSTVATTLFSLPIEAPKVEGTYTLYGVYSGASGVTDSAGEFFFNPNGQTFTGAPPGGSWDSGETFSTTFTFP